MPFSVQHQTEGNSMDDEYSSTLTVIDVFDIASEIGKEFEKIIDQYGPDAVTSIMPKVLSSRNRREKEDRTNPAISSLG
ncbi:RILP-like protein homolog [Diaphorina citri]|uniref:RILP-like protein homolog n=1 Tax=Diaphorina citri TaxID=121845 RepID=A0A3Q0ISB4_DIACI|nr:RILP-like protein homolog [Diaphorina citri]